MSGYTVYGMPPDALGLPYTEDDLDLYQTIIRQELRLAGIEDDVVVSEDWDRFTFLPSEDTHPELRAALERAWERFCDRPE